MKKYSLSFIVLFCTLALNACSARNPHSMDMTKAVQSASTNADHLALAQHYQEAAAEAQAKVAEHQQLLEQYRQKSYMYGKDIYNFEEHCEALMRIYQQAADANLKLAAMHRKLAASGGGAG